MKLYTEEQMLQAYDAGFQDFREGLIGRSYHVVESITPIKLPSDEDKIPLINALKFAEWMSSLIESNYKSGGNWYCNGEIKTTEQLYEMWMKEQILNQNK